MPSMSWPSKGPVYRTPRFSKNAGGSNISRIAATNPSTLFSSWCPTTGTSWRRRSRRERLRR